MSRRFSPEHDSYGVLPSADAPLPPLPFEKASLIGKCPPPDCTPAIERIRAKVGTKSYDLAALTPGELRGLDTALEKSALSRERSLRLEQWVPLALSALKRRGEDARSRQKIVRIWRELERPEYAPTEESENFVAYILLRENYLCTFAHIAPPTASTPAAPALYVAEQFLTKTAEPERTRWVAQSLEELFSFHQSIVMPALPKPDRERLGLLDPLKRMRESETVFSRNARMTSERRYTTIQAMLEYRARLYPVAEIFPERKMAAP